MTDNNSPYETSFSLPQLGLIKQELITYEIKNGMLRKVTTVRQFAGNDYTDTQTIEPLLSIENADA